MRKMFTLLLAAALAVTMLLPQAAFAGATNAPTPTLDEGTSLKWSYDFQSGTMDFSRAPTVPALINDAIYVGSANKVYRFNKDTGKIEATSPELPGRMGYGTTPVTSDEEGNIYVFVTGSQVVKLTPDLKQILWTSDKKYGGQNISPVKYIDGRVYSGTWGDDYESDPNEGGTFFCLDAETGKELWTTYSAAGFYWAGAALCDKAILYGTDDGVLYAANKESSTSDDWGKLDLSEAIGEKVSMRSTPAVEGDTAYVTVRVGNAMSWDATGKGYICKIKVSGMTMTLEKSAAIGPSVNMPVICDDLIFVGDNKGKVHCFDKELNEISAATAPGPVQGEISVSKYYEGKYVLTTAYNVRPGGLYCVETDRSGKVLKEGVFFTPEPTAEQYCISNIVCDDSGVMYYKNDSGAVMAVKSGIDTTAPSGLKGTAKAYNKVQFSWKARGNVQSYELYCTTTKKTYSATGTTYTVSNIEPGKVMTFKVRAKLWNGSYSNYSAAVKVKTTLKAPKASAKAGKKKITVSWKKIAGANGYVVYRATKKKGTYKVVKTMKKPATVTFTNNKLKKGKTYYYKVKAYRTVNGKKVYSAFSNIVSKKVK